MNEKGKQSHINDDPEWLRRFKRSTVAVVAGLAGVALVTTLEVTSKMLQVLKESGVTKSENMILAQESERSRFSDTFVRGAHRRVMLGEIFARRIQDDAPAEQIDEAFKSYIAALIDWNADLMINIVGLEQHYSAEKSRDFEWIILPKFVELDSAVRSLYLTRRGKAPLVGAADHPRRTVFEIATDIRETLYVFVRCIRQGQDVSKRTTCYLNEIIIPNRN